MQALKSETLSGMEKRALNWMLCAEIEQDTGADVHSLSLASYDQDDEFGGGTYSSQEAMTRLSAAFRRDCTSRPIRW